MANSTAVLDPTSAAPTTTFTVPLRIENSSGSALTNVQVYHFWQTGQVGEVLNFGNIPASPTITPPQNLNSGSGGYDCFIMFFTLPSGDLGALGLTNVQIYSADSPGVTFNIELDQVAFNKPTPDPPPVSWQKAYNAFTCAPSSAVADPKK